MPDKAPGKRKKLAPKGTKERAQQIQDATDFRKKAEAINAAAGTKLAKKGSAMRDSQMEYGLRKQNSISSSSDRESRLSTEAANIKKTRQQHIDNTHTFKNKDYNNISKRYKK